MGRVHVNQVPFMEKSTVLRATRADGECRRASHFRKPFRRRESDFDSLVQALYMLLTIYMVDWTLLLVILVGYYLDAKVKNFKLMCAVT